MLQCVAVCCSALQCVAVCVAVCDNFFSAYCSVLQCVAVCCSELQHVAVCCDVLKRVVVCCSVLQRLAVKTRQAVSGQRAGAPLAIMGVLQRVAATYCGQPAECLQIWSIWFRKCVLKTAACFVSHSSFPTLLPPISIFLMSIKVTMLDRDVYPPPASPAPPAPPTLTPPTTCIIMSRSNITPESDPHFWISRNQAADSKVMHKLSKQQPVSCLLLLLLPNPISFCLFSALNSHLEPPTHPPNTPPLLFASLWAPQSKLACFWKVKTHRLHHNRAARVINFLSFGVTPTRSIWSLHWLLRKFKCQDETQIPSAGWQRT